MAEIIEITGITELTRKLSANIEAGLQPALLAIAAALQNVIAPYPPAPSYIGRLSWYERGYGPRWLHRDGGIGGRKTSQFLNRSWYSEPRADATVVLGNRATYAPWVHGTRQTKVNQEYGWVNVATGKDRVVQDGTITRIIDTALRKILPIGE
jgi:hypothetical protein